MLHMLLARSAPVQYNKTSKQIISKEKFADLEFLRENKGTVIKNSDLSNSVVFVVKDSYNLRMESLLSDLIKFEKKYFK